MYRYERKYLVANEHLDALRKRITPFMRPDSYAVDKGNGIRQYTVRSIYYDTPAFNSLYEKWEGLEVRKKLRIRGYDLCTDDSQVFLEVKRKRGNRISKTRGQVPYSKLDDFLTYGLPVGKENGLSGRSETDAKRFLYNMHRYAYRPVNLIVYDREPFMGKFEPGLRITFDKNVKARMWPSTKDLFKDSGLAMVWKNSFVLEVKYGGEQMPSWIRSVIQEYALRHEALSKFAVPFSEKDISAYNLKLGA